VDIHLSHTPSVPFYLSLEAMHPYKGNPVKVGAALSLICPTLSFSRTLTAGIREREEAAWDGLTSCLNKTACRPVCVDVKANRNLDDR
jgi:hypothetical protein